MVADKNQDKIEQLIKQCCDAPPPGEEFSKSLAARAKQELTGVLQAQPKADAARARRGSPSARRLRSAALAVAGTAALIFIGVWLWIGQERNLWAQVADAVRAKSWVHGVAQPTEGGVAQPIEGGEKLEMWISLKNAVSAVRGGGWVLYDDGRSGVRQEYDPKEKEIYYVTAPEGTEKQIRSVQMIFSDLFRGSEKVGQFFTGPRIAKQEQRKLTDQGREWIEYTLSLEGANGPKCIVFRVDPQTHLPQSMSYFDTNDLRPETKPQVRFVLDYPEDGPADIYALGVSRSAKIVDRVPKPDLARVIDGVRASRQNFADSYYAIVVDPMGAPMIGQSDKWWQAATLYQVWCKGDCWRVERGSPHNMQYSLFYKPAEQPGEGVDKMAWWKEHLKDFDFEPSGVCDGKAIYAPKRAPPGAQVTQENAVWEIWRKINPGNPGEGNMWLASFGPASNVMPEFYAYPFSICEPYRYTDVELDANPSGYPAGALLLKYRHSSTDPNAIKSCRYWVDPARSYTTLRYELGEAEDAKAGPEAEWPDTYVMEDLAQAPSGIWYAAVVRRLCPGKMTSLDKRVIMVWRFFVDFKADMPDTLFKPGTLAAEKTTKAPPPSRGTGNLRTIAITMNRYHDSHGKFPAAWTVDKQGQPLLSWRVALLPFIGQEELYKQFHLDEPWDSQHNRTLIEKMPEIYSSQALGPYSPPGAKVKEPGQTNFVVPVGKETAFPGHDAVRVRDISDGCVNTIMAVEVDDEHAVLWSKPEDLPFDAANPDEGLTMLPKRGFWAVMCDGSVRWIPQDFDPKYLRAAFTRAGGEAIEW